LKYVLLIAASFSQWYQLVNLAQLYLNGLYHSEPLFSVFVCIVTCHIKANECLTRYGSTCCHYNVCHAYEWMSVVFICR